MLLYMFTLQAIYTYILIRLWWCFYISEKSCNFLQICSNTLLANLKWMDTPPDNENKITPLYFMSFLSHFSSSRPSFIRIFLTT